MPSRLQLTACALLAASACAAETRPEIAARAQAILGGVPAAENGWRNVGWLEAGCTATLVHERVLVFSAHCGPDHARVFFGQQFEIALDYDAGAASLPTPELYESVELSRCEAHPDAAIGSGSDIAFCELAEAVPDVPTVPLIAGCERERLEVGATATLVGFGFDAVERGEPGIKRVAQSPIAGLSREIYIGDSDAGSCPGDSGGPAFIRVDSDETRPNWRLAGVLSSGAVGRCGGGRYTDVTRVADWLESESGYDLTPCFGAEGEWTASPSCVVPPLDGDGKPIDGPDQYAAHCGSPFEPAGCSASNVGSGSAGLPGALGLIFCRLLRRRHPRSAEP